MKKTFAFILVSLMLVSMLSGCFLKDLFTVSDDKGSDSGENVSRDYFDYFALNLDEYITLGQYKGLEINMKPECSDEDIEEEIQYMLLNSTTINKITDRAAENGDTVNIDFVGYMDDVAFENGSGEDYPLTLGSGSFIDGFEEGLVGVMPGETVSLNISFPDPYPNNPDFAGLPVRFDVTVNYIEEEVIPEYTDAFVTEISEGEYTTTAEYSAYIRKSINETLAADVLKNKGSYLVEMVIENSEIKKLIDSELEINRSDMVNYYTTAAANYQISLGEFLMYFMGIDEETFYKKADEYAAQAVSANLVATAIAKAENITVSDEDYSTSLQELIDYYADQGYEIGASEIESEYGGKDGLSFYFLREKVMDFLCENSIEINGDVE